MKIQVEKVSPVERKVTVEVDPERVANELDRAYRELGQRVKVPGFRPGKIPRNVLERHYRSEIENEVLDRVVQETFVEAVKAESIGGVAPPHLSVTEGVGEGKPIRYTATVQVKDAFEPKLYRGLKVTRRTPEVTDKLLADEIEALRDRFAQLVTVEGRLEAKEGDFAVIDHDATVEGKSFQGSRADGVLVRVAKGSFGEGYLPQLEGKKIGDTVEFEDKLPELFRLPTVAGKTAHMTCVLKQLKEKQLPTIDDEFAKKLGLASVENVDGMKEQIKKDVTRRERDKADADYKEALVRAALENNSFEVPPALIERAVDAMIEGAAQRFARQGVDINELDFDFERMRGELREQALLQVRGTLLLEAIAEKEKIEVTEADIQAEAARIAEDTGTPLANVQQELHGRPQRRALTNRLREEKALAFMATATEPG